MRLRTRFNVALGSVFALGFILSILVTYAVVLQNAKDELLRNASLMMETALAVRNYTIEEIKPHLDPMLEATFLPQTVPAYSAIETFARLQKKYPDFSYREATLNPTNPRDRSTDWESRIIDDFRTAKSSVSVNRPAGRASTSPDRSGSPIPPAWPATARPPPRLPRCSPSMARTTASAGSSTKSSAPRSSSSPPTSRSATRCMPSGHSPQYSAHSSCCSS